MAQQPLNPISVMRLLSDTINFKTITRFMDYNYDTFLL